MICAIDFGSCWIRSVFRNPVAPERLSMFSERSEYSLIAKTEQHVRSLQDQQIPFAECEGSLVVPGNAAEKSQWLSRVPRTPLLVDGIVPADDPPARQMLNVLTEAMLPPLSGLHDLCVLTVPGVRDGSEQARKNEEFLCRLVRMQGYRAVVVNPAEAALLATCSDASFTGISIVMGAETTTICVARYGMALATETIAIGGNWIDAEIARQFKVQVWDEDGNSYLDIESIRQWKQQGTVQLRNPLGDRERLMSRLYSVVLDRVARTVSQMLSATPVRNALQRQRLSVMLSGGATMVEGFASLLTEQFIEHEIADRILSVRCAPDPATAVIRGALIYGELEARASAVEEAA
jgi:hypothetical protein